MFRKTKLKQFEEKLKKEKEKIESQLRSFAKEDKKLKGDWDTKYPHMDGGVGGQRLEEASDEVETYATLLPIEYSLETQLKDINLALEKIKKGTYGKCEKCGKMIALKKLEAFPAAKVCQNCQE